MTEVPDMDAMFADQKAGRRWRKKAEKARRGEDLVPAILSPGEVNPSPERLEQLGLTVEARHAREGGAPGSREDERNESR